MKRPVPSSRAGRLAVCILAFSTLFAMGRRGALAEELRLRKLEILPLELKENLVRNPGLEAVPDQGVPAAWVWDHRNTDATCEPDATIFRSKAPSLRIQNGTPYGPHVYGSLWTREAVRLEAGKTYTLSAYVRSADPGVSWIGGGSRWQFRRSLGRSGDAWRRESVTFKAGPEDVDFVPRINTDGPTPGFWIDDIKLEEGERPTPCAEEGGRFIVEPRKAEETVRVDDDFSLECDLVLPRPVKDARLVARVEGGSPLGVDLSAEAGAWSVRLVGSATDPADSHREVGLRLTEGGTVLAEGVMDVRFLSVRNARRRVAAIDAKLADLSRGIEAWKSRGLDPAYPLVPFTVLGEFVKFVLEDLDRGEIEWAFSQVAQLETLASDLEARLRRAPTIAESALLRVPRWTGTERAEVRGPSFVGPTAFPGGDGRVTRRPIFFVGYGHFGKAQADLEKFPAYGVNVIQMEFGPSSVFPSEGVVDDGAVRHALSVLDRASKAGVAVTLLVSPHYFPAWALDKYPHLRKRREGFLQYCLHAPEGRKLLVEFLKIALEPLADHPALHSICLSNEPVNVEEPCEYATLEWKAWLRARHGEIATLNARLRTDYTSFDAVPLPNPFDALKSPRTVLYEYTLFNQESFGNWHRTLADAVHSVAPRLPVHAKAMTWTFLRESDVGLGVDAELFARIGEIHGNDSVCFYSHGLGEFAQGWELCAMAYDLQRSTGDMPIFNTENHIIPDREIREVPPEHVRSALWQEAIHGQGATTVWVWERSYDPKSDCAGSILHRPACVAAEGIVALDLNRLALEVTQLQKETAKIWILHGTSTRFWDGGSFTDAMSKIYTALVFQGVKVGFVTERALERREIPSRGKILVPLVTHLSDAAFDALESVKERVVLVGGDALLSRDEYDGARLKRLAVETIPFVYSKTRWEDLQTILAGRLEAWGIGPPVELLMEDEGETKRLVPARGVEWLAAEFDGAMIVNVVNYRNRRARLTIRRGGKATRGTELLTGVTEEESFSMAPLEVKLLRLP